MHTINDGIELEARKSRLQSLAKLFLAMFGLFFFFGGNLIHFVHPQTGRFRAEIEGQVMAVLFFALHVGTIITTDRIGWGKVDPGGPKSLSEALRKCR